MPSSAATSAQKLILSSYTRSVVKKASGIKALFFDVDGVLTDGKIIYSEKGDEIKEFHVRDGLIISHLKKAGIVVGILSGRESASVARRANELKLDFCHQGLQDKRWACKQIMEHHKLKGADVAYVGDDINDTEVLELAGLSACPSDAPSYIRAMVDVVATVKGGKGVLREVADLILAAKGSFPDSEKQTNSKKK